MKGVFQRVERFRRVEPALLAGLVYPQIRVEGRRTASGVEVLGTTDLPDGTILRYEAVAGSRFLGLVGGRRRMGQVRVSGGRYAIAFEPSPWKGPVVEAAISVRADPGQPAWTQELLGPHGERLAGDVSGPGYSEYFVTERLRL
jgi:hypothetical protein